MAQPSNTFDTVDQIGAREDLADVISNVFPQEKPFTSMIGTRKVTKTYHEWQTDTLRTPVGTNAQIEGDEYSYNAITPTVRVGNHTQILRESFIVSGTANVQNLAGRQTEVAMQKVKHGHQLALDREVSLLANNASVAGNSTTAREMGGLAAWIETNARRGATGADGGFNSSTNIVDAATDGTQRTFAETLLKDMLQDVIDNSSGFPGYLMMSPSHKRLFSEFSGISELRDSARGTGNKNQQAMIVAGADQYLSDWGLLTVVFNRYQPGREVFAVNPAFVKRGVHRAMFSEEAPKTGDSHRHVILCEETLIVQNEKALGILADLT